MNPKIVEARHRLDVAQAAYRQALGGVDGMLRAAVAQDPANIPDAEDVQADYGMHGFRPAPLEPLEQPAGRPEDVVVPELDPATGMFSGSQAEAYAAAHGAAGEPVETMARSRATDYGDTGKTFVQGVPATPEEREAFAQDIGRPEEQA